MVRLIAVGDIHLGRRASGVPDDLVAAYPHAQSPATVWQRTVDHAIRVEADAVLLAGDVVEQEDDFFEAYGDLSAGVERLRQSGVAVLAVAGNHDVEVLPRLADSIPHVRLLGAGGRWERQSVRGRDGTEVHVLGWSFPSKEVSASPLQSGIADAMVAVSPGTTTIGLLHCDRDQTHSRYAPVRSAELDAAPVDAWFLGHIHRPDSLEGPRPMGYLGSLAALDVGEQGPHGPWDVAVAHGQVTAEHLPMAPLRWERIDVELDGTTTVAQIPGRIISA
ncbi:MAG: metallophosphoesterase, partial [Gammaproteobacteria bacterium]|nr:metallophosphoesterase [Gammaproteobacteria bacterium]